MFIQKHTLGVKTIEDVEDSITIVQGFLTLIGFILIGFILKQELNKTNSGVIQLETDKEFTGPILKFFKMRQSAQ